MSTRTKNNYSRISLYEYSKLNLSLQLVKDNLLFPFTDCENFKCGTSYPSICPFDNKYLLTFTSWNLSAKLRFENYAWYCILDSNFLPLTQPAHLPIIGSSLTGLTRIIPFGSFYFLSTSLFNGDDSNGPRYNICFSTFASIDAILRDSPQTMNRLHPISTSYARTTSSCFISLSDRLIIAYSARDSNSYRLIARNVQLDNCSFNIDGGEHDLFMMPNGKYQRLFYCYPSSLESNQLLVSSGRYGISGLKLLEVDN